MYTYDSQYLLPNRMSSPSFQDKSVKPKISYLVGPFQNEGVALMVPPAHCQLINMDQIQVDRIHRPLLRNAQIPLSNSLADHGCLKTFNMAAPKVRACFPSIQTPLKSPDSCYRRNSQWENDSCFLVQSRNATGRHGKPLRCLSYVQIKERKANLSLSQIETVTIPRCQNTETAISTMPQAQQMKSPLHKMEFCPHPYDDTASRSVYLSSKSSFLRKPPWNNSASLPLEIKKMPDQQHVKKKKRKVRKRKGRKRAESSEATPDSGKTNLLRNYSVDQMMNILTALSLDQTPHPPLEPRRQKPRHKAVDANALVPWKNEPAGKLSGLCEWIGQSRNRGNCVNSMIPSPPKGPKKRVRKGRRARVLRIRGHAISSLTEMPSPT